MSQGSRLETFSYEVIYSNVWTGETFLQYLTHCCHLISLRHGRNVNGRGEVRKRRRREGRQRWMQWCQPIPLLFSTNAAEQGWAGIPLLLTTDLIPHTHTQRLTHSHVTHTHTHHTTLTEALELRAALGDATGWQPLSKFPPLCSSFFLSLSLCRDCHSATRPSSFISHTLLCRCEMASVSSHWETFQTFLSVCRAHTLLSSPSLSLFSLHVSGDRSKSRTYLHVGAAPGLDAFMFE